MASKNRGLQRLKRIYERQVPARFGREYIPAILATRAEAPPNSRPSMLYSELVGRDLQFLSPNERAVALVVIRHRCCFEFHEQKMLSPEPSTHPLFGHRQGMGLKLPPVRGTLDVADRLGFIDIHPIVRACDPKQPESSKSLPSPYIGDLLVFYCDELGPYLINYTVKDKAVDFARTYQHARRDPEKDAYLAHARHEIEKAYYADAGIRTIRVAAKEDIDPIVFQNLDHVATKSVQPIDITPEQESVIVDLFIQAQYRGIPPYDMFEAHQRKLRCDWSTAYIVLARAIWQRRLRVDLFRPVLPNWPLNAEEVDIFDKYGNWFQRLPCS